MGKTKRSFKIRKSEHKKTKIISYLYMQQNNHNFDWKNFLLLDNKKNRNKFNMSKMVHIKLQKKNEIGSPISGLFANIDMEDLETEC